MSLLIEEEGGAKAGNRKLYETCPVVNGKGMIKWQNRKSPFFTFLIWEKIINGYSNHGLRGFWGTEYSHGLKVTESILIAKGKTALW